MVGSFLEGDLSRPRFEITTYFSLAFNPGLRIETKRLRKMTDPAPQSSFRHSLRRRLPPLYLAHVIGNAVASAIAFHLRGLILLPVFTVTSIALSSVLYLIFRRLSPREPEIPPRDLKEWLLNGVALFGVPMAIFFACYGTLPSLSWVTTRHLAQPGIFAIMLCLTGLFDILLGLLAGLGWGARMYYRARRAGTLPKGPAAQA